MYFFFLSDSINETMTKAMRVERNWKVMTMVSIILSVLLVSMLAAFLFYQYLITGNLRLIQSSSKRNFLKNYLYFRFEFMCVENNISD